MPPNAPKCSFCNNQLTATSPIGRDPCFRCYKCNVRILITNQSYLPEDIRKYYWILVLSKTLCKQTWADDIIHKH